MLSNLPFFSLPLLCLSLSFSSTILSLCPVGHLPFSPHLLTLLPYLHSVPHCSPCFHPCIQPHTAQPPSCNHPGPHHSPTKYSSVQFVLIHPPFLRSLPSNHAQPLTHFSCLHSTPYLIQRFEIVPLELEGRDKKE